MGKKGAARRGAALVKESSEGETSQASGQRSRANGKESFNGPIGGGRRGAPAAFVGVGLDAREA